MPGVSARFSELPELHFTTALEEPGGTPQRRPGVLRAEISESASGPRQTACLIVKETDMKQRPPT